MNPRTEAQQTIARAKRSSRRMLAEHEAKRVLAAFHIPCVQDIEAQTADECLQAARELGFPVVVKGYGPTLAHKTERGLVQLNLTSDQEVLRACEAIVNRGGDDLEGLLVQPQLSGKREFVAGLFRDPLFGPVIMFGLGGIYTEALQDISLRLAPLTRTDALDMIEDIRARSLLDHFRNEAPADMDELVRVLTGLSEISCQFPDIAEIDINPLLLSPEGDFSAADALVVLEDSVQSVPAPPRNSPETINPLFYPKSVVFVGASGQMGKWGHMLVTNTKSGGYRGDIYLVNPKGGTIVGQEALTSIRELPGQVDLAVITVPAAHVPDLLPELKDKGVKAIILITSGFSETGPEGRKAEDNLVRLAREAGMVILGPNTMGLCNPHIDFHCTGTIVHPRPGSTAMVSQSGNMGVQLLSFAVKQGIGIRAFCGSGNEAMLNIEDFLDCFAVDSLTKTVMLYVESVNDGPRFFHSARRLAQKKPVILLKGGESQAGNKAAASHTGAMSSNSKVFNALCSQAGIIKVEGPMDLLDLAAAFDAVPLPKGNRVAIMTLGGGWGVITADLCSKYGLEVPELSRELIETMDSMLPSYWSRSNPIDLVGERDLALPVKALKALLSWDGCDAVINLGVMGRRIFVRRYAEAILGIDPAYDRETIDQANEILKNFEDEYTSTIASLMTQYNKPVYGVSLEFDAQDKTVVEVKNSPYKTIFYQTPENAVKVCSKMYEYYTMLKKY